MSKEGLWVMNGELGMILIWNFKWMVGYICGYEF